ncbi:DciA family protein [Pseudomonadota bacterium]
MHNYVIKLQRTFMQTSRKRNRQISYAIRDVLKPISKKFSTSLHLIKQNWKDIIGEEYYRYCKAEKLSFSKKKEGNNKLTISVFNTAISMYISGNELYIIDKINSYFGKKLIHKIQLKHDPRIVEDVKFELFKRKIPEDKKQTLNKSIDGVKNNELKESLYNLGKEIYLSDDK